jgi:putative tryptophan/tyrosine transport system substrate-binding protein
MEKTGCSRNGITGVIMNKSCKRIAKALKSGSPLEGCIPLNNRIHYSIALGLFILVLLSLFMPDSSPARGQGDIIVLNSDMSIDKYSLVHTEFKSKITNLKGEIDLGSKWIDEARIEKMVFETDPDIIYCIGTKAYQMAYKLARNKKLIFSSAINWHRLPMGKKTYGVSNELPQGMQLTMYRYFFPDVETIGVLYSETYNKEWTDIALKSAKEAGIKIIDRPISKPDEVESALKKLLPKVDALWLTPDPVVLHEIELVNEIFKQTETARKPVFAYDKAFANFGAVLIISADISTMGRQAAALALDILAHQKITERVKNPAGSHIVLNMKKVEEYGINLNIEALDSVNEIIE